MTVNLSKLPAILDRLEAGNPLKSEDLEILVAGLTTKQITMATGKSAVAIGESADNATITSGDRNIVISKELAQTIQEKAGGKLDFHSGDRNTTNNYTFLIVNSDSTDKNNLLLQQLTLLLKDVNPETIQQAYQASLPVDANLRGMPEKDIIANLDDFRQIPTFIDRLMGDNSIPEDIRAKLAQNPLRSTESNPIESSKNLALESYLSIVIRPSLSSDRFLVNAWLIPDSTIKDRSQRFHPLDLDSTRKGISCSLERIPELLDKFLDLSLKYLKGDRDLTIEIFLPMNCLCAAVDRWMVADLYNDIPVGSRYRTIVRSSDRLEERYLAHRLKLWRDNWERITKAGHLKPNCNDFEKLDRFTDCNWKRIVNNLSQKLGLKLTCGLVAEHKQDLFKAILSAATPIAIWVRCDLPNLETEIDDLIAENHLFGLSTAVLKKRQQADEEERSVEHLGSHLAMLWEDPGRLTPDAMEWLLTPGQ